MPDQDKAKPQEQTRRGHLVDLAVSVGAIATAYGMNHHSRRYAIEQFENDLRTNHLLSGAILGENMTIDRLNTRPAEKSDYFDYCGKGSYKTPDGIPRMIHEAMIVPYWSSHASLNEQKNDSVLDHVKKDFNLGMFVAKLTTKPWEAGQAFKNTHTEKYLRTLVKLGPDNAVHLAYTGAFNDITTQQNTVHLQGLPAIYSHTLTSPMTVSFAGDYFAKDNIKRWKVVLIAPHIIYDFTTLGNIDRRDMGKMPDPSGGITVTYRLSPEQIAALGKEGLTVLTETLLDKWNDMHKLVHIDIEGMPSITRKPFAPYDATITRWIDDIAARIETLPKHQTREAQRRAIGQENGQERQ